MSNESILCSSLSRHRQCMCSDFQCVIDVHQGCEVCFHYVVFLTSSYIAVFVSDVGKSTTSELQQRP